MVFGWSKKKSEKEPETSAQKEIRLDQIASILSEIKNSKQNQTISYVKPLFANIQAELDSILKIIDHLSHDSLKVDDIDSQLKVIVTRSKTEIISTVSKEAKIQIPHLDTFADVEKATDLASQALKKIGDVLGKHSRVIHVFAKKYALDLKNHLGEITTNHASILRLVGSYAKFEADESHIIEKINKIISMDHALEDKNAQIPKLTSSSNDLGTSAALLKSKIDSLNSSPQHAKYVDVKNQIEKNKKEEDRLNKEIDEEFSKISRPLGKYVYVTSLEKPLKLLLDDLIQNPAKTITVENKDSVILVLESCMKGTLSGAVSVKETDKSVEQISSLIKRLDDFLDRKSKLAQKDSDLRGNLGIFDADALGELEQRLQKTLSDKSDIESKIGNLKSEITHDADVRAKMVSELSHDLQSISNIKYVIV